MYNAMMDPELMKIAQEQMSRISPEELAKFQKQMMANPDLIKMATESMKNMRTEDFKRAAEQMKNTRLEQMQEMTEKIAKASPDEIATMKARADAQISYELSGAKMLKQQGNEFHSRGQYSDAAKKYKLAKDNLKSMPTSAGQTLQMQCSLNLMSCYLKLGQFNDCVKEGSEVLSYDSKNVKALYRRGQAYKELGSLDAAVADLSKAHESSPEDETIADVLRDTKERLSSSSKNRTVSQGVIIEEIEDGEEAAFSSSSSESNSAPEYSMEYSNATVESRERSSFPETPINPDRLKNFGDDPDAIRAFQNYVSSTNPETLSRLGMQGMSPEMIRTASDMIKTMKPDELQNMFQAASSLKNKSPLGPDPGPGGIPEMSPEMVKLASDTISKMSPDELQRMLSAASSLGTSNNIPSPPTVSSSTITNMERNSNGSGRAESGAQSSAPSRSFFTEKGKSLLSGNPIPSTPDLQESVRKSMQDPATRQMFTNMMKNMSPEMMASMSQQFGMNFSKEDAVKAQQAMASLSPEDLDRMMRWAEKAQRGIETVKKAKNWLLGRRGMILAIVMLILAFILHQLGFIGG